KWVQFLKEVGFDGWEEASWELDLRRCDTDSGAEAYAKERVALAQRHGLEIFTIAVHLQGQALGDEPSAKTLQFVGKGEARAANGEGLARGTRPPRPAPYSAPERVGKLPPRGPPRALVARAGLPLSLGMSRARRVPLPGFGGPPPPCGALFFLSPPLP